MKDTLLLQKIDAYDNNRISDLIDNNIKGKYAERNRKILKRRILDGICYEPLAEEFDLSVRQTQNIVYDGMSTLLRFI